MGVSQSFIFQSGALMDGRKPILIFQSGALWEGRSQFYFKLHTKPLIFCGFFVSAILFNSIFLLILGVFKPKVCT